MSKQIIQMMLGMSDKELEAYLTELGMTELKKMMRMALKEQDRDTRHACAEVLNTCTKTNGSFIGLSQAQADITNCLGGLTFP